MILLSSPAAPPATSYVPATRPNETPGTDRRSTCEPAPGVHTHDYSTDDDDDDDNDDNPTSVSQKEEMGEEREGRMNAPRREGERERKKSMESGTEGQSLCQ